MSKRSKLGSLICFILVLSVFMPAISIASARKTGKGQLEKIVFIHYRKGYGKPPGTPGKGPDKDDGGDEGHYKLLGAKWKSLPVSYVIDPDNPDGLTEDFIVAAITGSAEEWDKNTGIELFDDTYIIDHTATWDDDAPDGRNELVFGDYDKEGVIAVTIIWGYFRGASGKGEIIEFDIMFDTDYEWGYAGITDEDDLGTLVMDLQNIATHELGHGVGLADLYDSSASEETMYGLSEYGETKKRTLYIGDEAGIKKLYG